MSEILAAMQPWVTFFTKAILINRNPAGQLPARIVPTGPCVSVFV